MGTVPLKSDKPCFRFVDTQRTIYLLLLHPCSSRLIEKYFFSRFSNIGVSPCFSCIGLSPIRSLLLRILFFFLMLSYSFKCYNCTIIIFYLVLISPVLFTSKSLSSCPPYSSSLWSGDSYFMSMYRTSRSMSPPIQLS